jgi:hypothetical protein
LNKGKNRNIPTDNKFSLLIAIATSSCFKNSPKIESTCESPTITNPQLVFNKQLLMMGESKLGSPLPLGKWGALVLKRNFSKVYAFLMRFTHLFEHTYFYGKNLPSKK